MIPDRDWIEGWGSRYDTAHDERLFDPWQRTERLPRKGWEDLIAWKFVRDGRRRKAALNGVAAQHDVTLEELTAAALRFDGDWYPLRIVSLPRGTGAAMGSAVLACIAPDRFSLYDINANRAARSFGADVSQSVTINGYGRYMSWVRRVADAADMSLRAVDRALFVAGKQISWGDEPPPVPVAE